MCSLKSKIDERNNSRLWDKAKRKINPYELVNSYGTNLSNYSQNYQNIIPLSRAFFKLTELLYSTDIIPENYINNSGVIANTAEGPGGFIEALYKYRTSMNIIDKHYGISSFFIIFYFF